MNVDNWANRAKRLMQDKGITQGDLAPILGKETRGAVGHYFTGRTQPTLEQYQAMADFFDVSLSYLLTGDKDSKRINSNKLESCIKVVALVIKKNDLKISEDQQAKLVAFLYAETPNDEEASEATTLDLTSFFVT